MKKVNKQNDRHARFLNKVRLSVIRLIVDFELSRIEGQRKPNKNLVIKLK